MDLLSKISREHGQVYESLAVFEKISAFEQASEPFENMRDFFRDLLLPHFQFEEEHIFPVMLAKASEQEKAVTRDIAYEHYKITAAFGRLSAVWGSVSDGEANVIFKNIIKMILDHTRKEDISLYPAFKKYL